MGDELDVAKFCQTSSGHQIHRRRMNLHETKYHNAQVGAVARNKPSARRSGHREQGNQSQEAHRYQNEDPFGESCSIYHARAALRTSVQRFRKKSTKAR